MKYPVEVNDKWLVSVEAESAQAAGQKIIDYNHGVWRALAFDQKAIQTDTFLKAVQACEMISYSKLHLMAVDLMETGKDVEKAAADLMTATEKVQRFRELLARAEAEAAKAEQNLDEIKAVYDEKRNCFSGIDCK